MNLPMDSYLDDIGSSSLAKFWHLLPVVHMLNASSLEKKNKKISIYSYLILLSCMVSLFKTHHLTLGTPNNL